MEVDGSWLWDLSSGLAMLAHGQFKRVIGNERWPFTDDPLRLTGQRRDAPLGLAMRVQGAV
jgi:hypothetical protein